MLSTVYKCCPQVLSFTRGHASLVARAATTSLLATSGGRRCNNRTTKTPSRLATSCLCHHHLHCHHSTEYHCSNTAHGDFGRRCFSSSDNSNDSSSNDDSSNDDSSDDDSSDDDSSDDDSSNDDSKGDNRNDNKRRKSSPPVPPPTRLSDDEVFEQYLKYVKVLAAYDDTSTPERVAYIGKIVEDILEHIETREKPGTKRRGRDYIYTLMRRAAPSNNKRSNVNKASAEAKLQELVYTRHALRHGKVKLKMMRSKNKLGDSFGLDRRENLTLDQAKKILKEQWRWGVSITYQHMQKKTAERRERARFQEERTAANRAKKQQKEREQEQQDEGQQEQGLQEQGLREEGQQAEGEDGQENTSDGATVANTQVETQLQHDEKNETV